jgi:hypothetical protein
MPVKFFKTESLNALLSQISENLESYQNGDFTNNGFDDPQHSFESLGDVNIAELETLQIPTALDNFEAENSEIVFGAFREITRYQATDVRMWTYYVHLFALEYARARYKKIVSSDESVALTAIRNHVFASNESRYLRRNNALARLWWNQRLVLDVDPYNTPELLRVLLINTDHRATLIERPTGFASNAFCAKLLYSLEKYRETPRHQYFDAPRQRSGAEASVTHYNYRHANKLLNRLGGATNLAFLKPEEIVEMIRRDESNFNDKFGLTR